MTPKASSDIDTRSVAALGITLYSALSYGWLQAQGLVNIRVANSIFTPCCLQRSIFIPLNSFH